MHTKIFMPAWSKTESKKERCDMKAKVMNVRVILLTMGLALGSANAWVPIGIYLLLIQFFFSGSSGGLAGGAYHLSLGTIFIWPGSIS